MKKKIIFLLFMCLFLSGCHSLYSQIIGSESYKSDVEFIMLDEDGSKHNSYNAILITGLKWEYFTFRYDVGHSIIGMPNIAYDHADEMIEKLTIFLKWSKLPYEERISTMSEVQNLLPNNIPNNPKGKTSTTDFFLFHDNEKNPYLTFKRNSDLFSLYPPEYVSITPKSAIKMIIEIKYIKIMRAEYEKEHNKK